MSLPNFTSDGVLPAGDFQLTIAELAQSMLVVGRGGVTGPSWDSKWRRTLVSNAEVLIRQLMDVAITEIFLDGSFVENKDHPGDIDGYFECPWQRIASGDLERELNLRDPRSAWTWSAYDRQLYAGKMRLPMWLHYRVELYPHPTGFPLPALCGIRDKHGNELEFPAAFRQSRSFAQKGLIKIRP